MLARVLVVEDEPHIRELVCLHLGHEGYACDSTANGEQALRLAEAERFDLIVEDTGRGIAPEHLSHIFDRFYQAPNSDSNGERGLGLGLSFVSWIAKAHGGSVEVESEPNKGSRFTVSLPASPIEPAPDQLATEVSGAASSV